MSSVLANFSLVISFTPSVNSFTFKCLLDGCCGMVLVTAMYWWAIAGKNFFTDAACGRILVEEGLEGSAGGTRPCFCYILRNEALKSPWRWAGTLYAVMLFSVLNWEQQCMLMYSSKCLCIFLDWNKRFLLFLLSFFLFFSFQFVLNATGVKICWLRLPCAIFSYWFIVFLSSKKGDRKPM